MEKLLEQIFSNILAGKIDKEAGRQLLMTLKEKNNVNDSGHMAIVGMSAQLPQADSIHQFWENVSGGRDCVTSFPKDRQTDIENLVQYTYMKGQEIRYAEGGYLHKIDGFDYKFFNISPKEASLMDPAQRLFLQVAWNALEDAGYGGDQLVGSRTGVYVGYSGWPMYGQFVSQTEPEAFALSVFGNISAIIAKRLSQQLNLCGPSMLIDSSCSSSLVALHLATRAIRNGECEQAVVGGIRLLLMPVEGSITYGIESKHQRAKVFDDDADGTVLSEGVAAIFIKPLEKAIRDGDSIYAIVRGSTVNQDGHSTGIATPNVLAQEDVLLRAWEDAGIHPETIGCIETMGTATKIGDPVEIDAIKKAMSRFTGKKQFCAVGSLKTNIGHTDSTAGIAAVIKMALALHHKKIPPTIHFTRPNSSIHFEQTPVYINDRLQEWNRDIVPRRCGVSSFGFSGTNCHVILEEAPETVRKMGEGNNRPWMFVLSAKSEQALLNQVEQYVQDLMKGSEMLETSAEIGNICYTAATGRGHYSHRLSFVVQNVKELLNKLLLIHSIPIKEWMDNSGNYYFYGITGSRSSKELEQQVMEAISKKESEDEDAELLESLSRLYSQGATLPWQHVFAAESFRRIHLPVYPFDQFRCWMKIPEPAQGKQKFDPPRSIKKEDVVFNF